MVISWLKYLACRFLYQRFAIEVTLYNAWLEV